MSIAAGRPHVTFLYPSSLLDPLLVRIRLSILAKIHDISVRRNHVRQSPDERRFFVIPAVESSSCLLVVFHHAWRAVIFVNHIISISTTRLFYRQLRKAGNRSPFNCPLVSTSRQLLTTTVQLTLQGRGQKLPASVATGHYGFNDDSTNNKSKYYYNVSQRNQRTNPLESSRTHSPSTINRNYNHLSGNKSVPAAAAMYGQFWLQ